MERIGITVDVSTSDHLFVLVDGNGYDKPLLGKFIGIEYVREGEKCMYIGVVSDFMLSNSVVSAENVSALRNKIDVYTAIDVIEKINRNSSVYLLRLVPYAAFNMKTKKRIPVDTIIPLKSACYLLQEDDLKNILSEDERFVSVGRYVGTSIKQPLLLSDFTKEAIHFCIAGQTGSGKSTMAMMLLSLFATRFKDMRFVIIDPVGEFAKAFNNSPDVFLPLGEIFSATGRNPVILNSRNTAFDRWEIFKELLIHRKVFRELDVKSDSNYQSEAADFLIDYIREKKGSMETIYEKTEEFVNELLSDEDVRQRFISKVYLSENSKSRVANAIKDTLKIGNFLQTIRQISEYFKGKEYKVAASINNLVEGRISILVIDLSGFTVDGDEKIKYILVKEICKTLYRKAQESYIKQDRSLNTLVLLDEAHRFAPSTTPEDETMQEVKEIVRTAFIETRKFGLGWAVISTRISNLDKKLYEHSRAKFLGYGLLTGQDKDLLIETFGRDAFNRYRLLPDPTDPLEDSKVVGFMVDTPFNVLSRVEPEIISVFNSKEEFLRENGIHLQENTNTAGSTAGYTGYDEMLILRNIKGIR